MKIHVDPALQRLIRRHERLKRRSTDDLLKYGTIDGLTLRMDDDGELLLYRPQGSLPEHARTFLDDLRRASDRPARHDGPDADQSAEA